MTYTRDLIHTIKKNAGKVPKHIMANSLGISINFLERIASQHGYDLRLIAEPPSGGEPMSAHVADHPTRRHFGPRRDGRTEQAMIRLFPSDARLIDAIGSAQGLRRGQTLCRIIENARDRGLIDELVRLPAPKPEGEGA